MPKHRAGLPGDWKALGPYLSERAWGTVREDYSAGGNAWDYFPHDHARSRAYRWNEDGLAGICDINQRLCLALAFWNGRDPFLKERIFGLSNSEGNHGEDAKEYWWYLDATPTASWLRWRYHYPQAVFPYERLRAENADAPGRRASSNCSTPAFSTTIATGRLPPTTPRPRRATFACVFASAMPDPSRTSCTCCRRCGSEIAGPGRRGARGR